jgi:hypothetical protein
MYVVRRLASASSSRMVVERPIGCGDEMGDMFMVTVMIMELLRRLRLWSPKFLLPEMTFCIFASVRTLEDG